MLILMSLIGLSLAETNPFLSLREALEFMDKESPEKRFFYSAKEQRREAKENYEEKCERKFINAALSKPRWCPELDAWPQWVAVSRNDGFKSKFNQKPGLLVRPYPNQNQFPNGYPRNQFSFNQINGNNRNNFDINKYPFNQNPNIQFNNQFNPNNQQNFPFRN